MRRREFIGLIAGTAAAWPISARTQQLAMPVIGYLSSGSQDSDAFRVNAFRKGLKESGFIEGQNVKIEFRWAENHFERLSSLATELADRSVAVMATGGGTQTAVAAKAASKTIPIVFVIGADPVKFGLVASLNRPGGNATGVSSLTNILLAKQLEVLLEAVPAAALVGFLINPANPNAGPDITELRAAAEVVGRRLLIVEARVESDLDMAFSTLVQHRVDAVLVHSDPLSLSRREQLVGLAARNALPAIYWSRQFVAAGGLMSYGGSLADAHQQAGLYTGRILKGEQPADLPIQQSTKVELVLNLKTARALGLTFPLSLLGRADEVIE
jgi:putative tryptophan/tyrosine transport system substrate-binding protein